MQGGAAEGSCPGISAWYLRPCSYWLFLTTTAADGAQTSLVSCARPQPWPGHPAQPHPQHGKQEWVPLCKQHLSVSVSKEQGGLVPTGLSFLKGCRNPVGPWLPHWLTLKVTRVASYSEDTQAPAWPSSRRVSRHQAALMGGSDGVGSDGRGTGTLFP